jgi:hypothetical protein
MKKPFLLLIVVAFLTACSGRVPTPQVAHAKLTKHFHKYGKKYKDSEFGRHAVGRIEIVSVHEIQKKLAEAEAYVALLDGPTYRIRAIFERKPFGWKIISWEDLGSNVGEKSGNPR